MVIDWNSSKHAYVSTCDSSCETVKVSVIKWLVQALKELGIEFEKPILYCDNQAARAIVVKDVMNSKAKHIDSRHHHLRETIDNGDFEIKYVRHGELDIFTKCLVGNVFMGNRNKLVHT